MKVWILIAMAVGFSSQAFARPKMCKAVEVALGQTLGYEALEKKAQAAMQKIGVADEMKQLKAAKERIVSLKKYIEVQKQELSGAVSKQDFVNAQKFKVEVQSSEARVTALEGTIQSLRNRITTKGQLSGLKDEYGFDYEYGFYFYQNVASSEFVQVQKGGEYCNGDYTPDRILIAKQFDGTTVRAVGAMCGNKIDEETLEEYTTLMLGRDCYVPREY